MNNKKELLGLILCDGGFSSSLISAKLTELGKPYNLKFDESGLALTKMEKAVDKYDIVLFAPHLRAAYEDYEDLFDDKNVPFIQVEQKEYLASEPAITKLFERIKKDLNLSE